MCLFTIFWQQSYLLVINNWDEVEYYGIYEPNIISVTSSLIFFKLIEHGAEIIFKFILSKVTKEIFIN